METIFEAIAARSPDRVRDAIRVSGDLVSSTTRDSRGWTPLMAASAVLRFRPASEFEAEIPT